MCPAVKFIIVSLIWNVVFNSENREKKAEICRFHQFTSTDSFQIRYQWRTQDFVSGGSRSSNRGKIFLHGDFFEGGSPGHLKAIMRPPQGVRGAKAPRTVAKFHFFKRCKVLENESSFQKYKHFTCPKNLFFSKKKFEKLNIFDRNF